MHAYNLKYIWSICLAAAMGGLLFGYDWVVIGGAKPFYEIFFNLTSSWQIGWAVSSALVGCLIGSLFSGATSDRFGRKRLLILAAFLFTFSAIGTALSFTFTIFVLFRLLGGIGIGLASNLSPMYIAEASPAEVRGKFVSLNQLTIVLGILSAQIVNWLIAESVSDAATSMQILNSWNGQIGWRWMFGAELAPAALFLGLMFIIPESPRWLVKNARFDEAKIILAKIGGEEYSKTEFREIELSLKDNLEKVDFRELFEPGMVKILTVGVVLAVFQQWSGINVIFNYAEEVFSAAGYGVNDILLNIVITGIVNVIFTFVAIKTVDKWGRKPLLLFGAGSLSVSYIFIGLSYYLNSQGVHVLIAVVCAIACFAMSLGPVIWVVISEIFPNRIRGAAVSVAVFSLWSACFILVYTFPFLNEGLGAAGTFWIYALICILGFFYILKNLPETKNKTLEVIEKELVG